MERSDVPYEPEATQTWVQARFEDNEFAAWWPTCPKNCPRCGIDRAARLASQAIVEVMYGETGSLGVYESGTTVDNWSPGVEQSSPGVDAE